MILGPASTHWWVKLGRGVSGCSGPGAGVCLLLVGAGAQGGLGLVLTHWEAELGPAVSGCRAVGVLDLVPGCGARA